MVQVIGLKAATRQTLLTVRILVRLTNNCTACLCCGEMRKLQTAREIRCMGEGMAARKPFASHVGVRGDFGAIKDLSRTVWKQDYGYEHLAHG
jgi:hypothetical protein